MKTDDVISSEHANSFEKATEDRLSFAWKDNFSKDEKRKLRRWLIDATINAQEVLGVFPFDMKYVMHRVDSANRAVIFGRTRQKIQRNIHFYIDPSYPLTDFECDWVAPHELSHMALPFVGRQNAWFAEGFATYMSRKVMIHNDVYTPDEVEREYQYKFKGVQPSFQSSKAFIYVADSLIKAYNFPHMYWGSASYFYTVDKELQICRQITLTDVIQNYQFGYTSRDTTLDMVINSLDEISETDIFRKNLIRYQTIPSRQIFSELERYYK